MGCAGSTIKDAQGNRAAAMGLSVDAAPRPASDFKVIMAGDLAVGKSCIVKRFTSERFDPALPPTIGGAFTSKEVIIEGQNSEVAVKLLVWDTAGEELYRAMTKSFFKGAAGWVEDFRSHNPDGIIIVAGNKCDMPPEKHRVTEEDVDDIMARMRPKIEADGGALVHMSVSALTGEGVQGAFSSIALQLAERHLGLKPVGA